jgi:hypothetical protein
LPFTNITNTAALVNSTNAGIFDDTAKNDLRTVGDAQLSTSQYKWGSSSIRFDGSGDGVKANSTTPGLILRTGDFTVEMWMYPAASSQSASVAQGDNSSPVIYLNSGNLWFGTSAVNWLIQTSTAPTANQWSHVAVTRAGTTINIYLNGVIVGTTSSGQDFTGAMYNLGGDPAGSSTFNGYIDDYRITKGVARYTTNFTPPTSALQNQ